MLVVAELLLVCWGVHACSLCCVLVSGRLFLGESMLVLWQAIHVSILYIPARERYDTLLCTLAGSSRAHAAGSSLHKQGSTLIPLALVSSAVCVTLLLANFSLVAPGSVVQCLIVLAFVCCETTAKTSKHENRVSPATF